MLNRLTSGLMLVFDRPGLSRSRTISLIACSIRSLREEEEEEVEERGGGGGRKERERRRRRSKREREEEEVEERGGGGRREMGRRGTYHVYNVLPL